jgi:hypothetical protein
MQAPASDRLRAGESIPYAWDYPLDRHVVTVHVEGTDLRQSYELDAIRHHRSIGFGKKVLTVSVFADGPTKVLCICEKDEEGKLLVTPEARAPVSKVHKGRFKVKVKLSCVTVTLINGVPQELLLFDFEQVGHQFVCAVRYF